LTPVDEEIQNDDVFWSDWGEQVYGWWAESYPDWWAD